MYINLANIDFNPGQGGGGVKPSGTLEISGNGIYNVYSYASASVDIHPSISLLETYISNGVYNITGEFNGGIVNVNVPTDGINGWDQKSFTEGVIEIINVYNSASFVASSMFMSNKKIKTVNLPYATSVGVRAFRMCTSLSQVNLPMCDYIGFDAFWGCWSLSQFSLPVCTYISDSAFGSCRSLTQVDLPMCSYIGKSAFGGCSKLTQVNLPMCNYIDSSAFITCRSMTQISLPVCTYIGDAAFFAYRPLTQVDLPMCSYIGNSAFAGCRSITQISLPVCSYIGNGAFNGCSLLSIITIGYSDMCVVGSNTFNATPITEGTGSIYVPASLVDTYKSAETWSVFSSQIFPIE